MHSWDKSAMQQLRAAPSRGDGAAVVEVLSDRVMDNVLQLAGDGLLAAVIDDVPRAAGLAATCEAALHKLGRARAWVADQGYRPVKATRS